MYNNVRPPYENELYHHGILGMHWGVRRYQPYRKGDKVKGGKEIGKATKVEQRPISERIKKGIAAVNKIKKEMHKGKLEKAEYKYEMAQLKDAKKEVKKARRRQAEERIRERVRERREAINEEKRLEEERKDRNLERARGIAESAATIGTMLYGAYQLKKRAQDSGLLGSSSGSSNASGGTPSITTSGSSRPRLTSYNPNSHGGHGSGGFTPTFSSSGSGSSSSSSSGGHGLNIHTSGFHSQPAAGSTVPRSILRGSASSMRSEQRQATKRSIASNLTSAINKLANKSNKSDEDRYALLGLRALQNRVNSAGEDQFSGNGMGHLANLTPDQLIRRQAQLRHDDEDDEYLEHHGVKGMHWGVRRYQSRKKGKRVKGNKFINKVINKLKSIQTKGGTIHDRFAQQRIAEDNRLFTENAIRAHHQNMQTAQLANDNAMQIHNQNMQTFNDNHNYVNQLHTQMHIQPHVDTFTHMPMHMPMF